MPFNTTLFLTIIAWMWGGSTLYHIVNIWIATTEKEKIVSLLSAIFMLVALGACLVL